MRSAMLARIETIKATRRPASWVTLLALAGLLTLIYASSYRSHLHNPKAPPFALPGAWGEAIGGPAVLTAFFGAVLLILLIAGEFSWRTARQNVIDGLSKEEFFLAKLSLVPMVAVVFLAVPLLIAGGLAALATPAGTQVVRRGDLLLLAGGLLRDVGYLSVGFVIAMLARSTGAAAGLFLLYSVAEQVIASGIGAIGGAARQLAGLLPLMAFNALGEPGQYALKSLGHASHPAKPMAPTSLLVAVALGWIMLFLLVAFWSVRRRDL